MQSGQMWDRGGSWLEAGNMWLGVCHKWGRILYLDRGGSWLRSGDTAEQAGRIAGYGSHSWVWEP